MRASRRAIPQKSVIPAITRPAPTNAGMTRSQGETRSRERDAEQNQAAGSDLDLAHQRQGRLAVDHDRQAGPLPRLQPAGQLAGLVAAGTGQQRRRLGGAVAAVAVEDDGLARLGAPASGLDAGERYGTRAGDPLARMLIRLAHVDQQGLATLEPGLRRGRINARQVRGRHLP